MTPNEARAKLDLPPVAGGASPYLQQQNYSLAALDKRNSLDDPFKANTPPPPPAGQNTPPAPDENTGDASNVDGNAGQRAIDAFARKLAAA